MAIAQINENSFAALLDARIAKLKPMDEAKLIEHSPPKVEVKPALPRVPDKRFRRI
jgi:hypothetical protein